MCVCVCVWSPHLLYPFLCEWTLGLLHVLAVVNNTSGNIGVHVLFQIRFLGQVVFVCVCVCECVCSWSSSIHVCVCVCARVCVWSPHLLYPFLCEWTRGLLHVLAVVNNASSNIGVHVSFKSGFFNVYPGVKLLDHMVVLVFVFCEPLYCVLQWLHPFTFSLTMYRCSLSLYPHQHLLFVFFLMVSILTGVR